MAQNYELLESIYFFLREILNLVNNIVWYQYQGLQTNFK